MKKLRFILIFLLSLFSASAFGQVVKTAAVPYTKGSGYTPNITSSSEIRVDTATSGLYWWNRDALTWVRFYPGVDVITGSIPPAYTPVDNQSLFAVNDDDELYYYNGSAWVQIGGSGGGGIYGGSGTVPDATVATLADDFEFSGPDISSFTVTTGTTNGGQYFSNLSGATVSHRDSSGQSALEFTGTGANFNFTDGSTDRLTITGRDARYAADYSGTFSARSLVDKGYVDGAVSGEVSIPDGEIAFGNATSDGITSSSALTFDGDALTNQLISLEGSSGSIDGRDGSFRDLGASSSTSGGAITIGNYDGAAMSNGHRMGVLQWGANTGVGSTSVGASIQGFAAANWSGTSSPGELRFSTTPSGTLTEKERFRLTRSATAELRNATALSFYNSADNGVLEISVADSAAYIYGLGASSEGELVLQAKIGLYYLGTAALTGNTNNLWVGGGNMWEIGSDGAYDLTGVLGGMRNNGSRLVFVRNTGNFVITLKDESASSTAANRFDLDGEDYEWQPNELLIWVYDDGADRWYVLNKSGGSSGITQETNAPPTLYPSQITATQNDYSPTGYSTTISQTIQVDGDGSFRTITGLAAATRDGVEKTFVNDGTNCYILAKQHTGSSAGNRFNVSKDVIMFPGMSATLRYDSVGAGWRLKCSNQSEITYGNSVSLSLKHNSGTVASADNPSYSFTTSGGSIQANGALSTIPMRHLGFSTSTAATAFPSMSTKTQPIYLLVNTSYIRVFAKVKIPSSLSTAAEDYDIRVGFKSSIDTNITEGAYISYQYEENSGGWVLKTNDNSTTNPVNAGAAISADAVYNLELIYYPYGTDVVAFINGTRYVSSSNIPTALAVRPFAMIDKDNGTTARQMYLLDFDVIGINVSD